jgi:hypothetical protein
MPVRPTQLAILASLGEPQAVRSLAKTNDLPYDTAYKAVRQLEKRAVVATHHEGRALVAMSRSGLLPSLARSLLHDHPRSDWGQVFHGDRPTLLHVLNAVGEPELAAEICDKCRSLVYHAIAAHAPRGLLVREGGKYAINPRLSTLRNLLAEWDRTAAAHHLYEIDPTATPIWNLGPDLLFASRRRIADKRVQLGALSRFERYGLPLVLGEMTYYCTTKRRLDAADAILQSLLVEPESKVNRSYCALLLEKAKPRDLLRKARMYGLVEEARALARYTDTHESTGKFLPWAEHERYRTQYGVMA